MDAVNAALEFETSDVAQRRTASAQHNTNLPVMAWEPGSDFGFLMVERCTPITYLEAVAGHVPRCRNDITACHGNSDVGRLFGRWQGCKLLGKCLAPKSSDSRRFASCLELGCVVLCSASNKHGCYSAASCYYDGCARALCMRWTDDSKEAARRKFSHQARSTACWLPTFYSKR